VWTVNSDHDQVKEEANVAVSYDQSAIPCEFCLELFDEHTITEHQVSILILLQSVDVAVALRLLLKVQTDTKIYLHIAHTLPALSLLNWAIAF